MTDINQVTDTVIQLARTLRVGRRAILAQCKLELWEYDVLAALRGASTSAGLTPGQLTSTTQVTSGTMTNRVDQLARRGFVTREPDPSDRRGVLVRLTPTGRRRIDRACTDIEAAESLLLATLNKRTTEQLSTVLNRLLETFTR